MDIRRKTPPVVQTETHDSGARQCATLRVCPGWTKHPRDWCGMFWLPHAAPTPHFFQSFHPWDSGRLGHVPSWVAPALNTGSNREGLIAQNITNIQGWFSIIGPFPALDPEDSISKQNENCQAWTCLKRRTLFTTHKHWLGASSKALSLQTPFIKGLSGVCLLLFTLPICRRGPEPFQINQSNTPLWS